MTELSPNVIAALKAAGFHGGPQTPEEKEDAALVDMALKGELTEVQKDRADILEMLNELRRDSGMPERNWSGQITKGAPEPPVEDPQEKPPTSYEKALEEYGAGRMTTAEFEPLRKAHDAARRK